MEEISIFISPFSGKIKFTEKGNKSYKILYMKALYIEKVWKEKSDPIKTRNTNNITPNPGKSSVADEKFYPKPNLLCTENVTIQISISLSLFRAICYSLTPPDCKMKVDALNDR